MDLWAGGPCHDACLNAGHVRLGQSGVGQHVHKHGGCAVDGGTLFLLYGLHTGLSIKAWAGHHAGGPHQVGSQSPSNIPETVVEWNRHTDTVGLQNEYVVCIKI